MRGPGRPRKENHDFIGLKMPHSIIGNPEDPDIDEQYTIEKYQRDFNISTRTQAIIELVRMSLRIIEKRHLIRDPLIVQELSDRMEQTQIVDYFATLPDQKLNALFEIIKNERDIRTTYRKSPASAAMEHGR